MEALMIGVSGMRGTIGGTLTPEVVQRMAAAFATYLKHNTPGKRLKVVIGRDSRPSGFWVRDCTVGTLVASGIEVVDLDIVSTPGVAMMTKHSRRRRRRHRHRVAQSDRMERAEVFDSRSRRPAA